MEPHDYWIYHVNIDLRHQYGISVANVPPREEEGEEEEEEEKEEMSFACSPFRSLGLKKRDATCIYYL